MSAPSECTEATDRFTEGVHTPITTEPDSYNAPKPAAFHNSKTLESHESNNPDQFWIQLNDVETTVAQLRSESGMHANELLEVKRGINEQAKRLKRKENELRSVIQEEVERMTNVLCALHEETAHTAASGIDGLSESLDTNIGELWTALNTKTEHLPTLITALQRDISNYSTHSQSNEKAIRRHEEQSKSEFSKQQTTNDKLNGYYHNLDNELRGVALRRAETDRKVATLENTISTTRSEQRELETKLESSIKSQKELRDDLKFVTELFTTIESRLEGFGKEQKRMDAQIKDLIENIIFVSIIFVGIIFVFIAFKVVAHMIIAFKVVAYTIIAFKVVAYMI